MLDNNRRAPPYFDSLVVNFDESNGNLITWQLADALHLPLNNNSVDVVFCIEAIFHFQSRVDFLREVTRGLKSNGAVCWQ